MSSKAERYISIFAGHLTVTAPFLETHSRAQKMSREPLCKEKLGTFKKKEKKKKEFNEWVKKRR